MTVPLTTRNRNTLIYADLISSVWAWWDYITDMGYAVQQELDVWEILQRDPKCYQGIQQRLNDVAGPDWRCFPNGNSKRQGEKIKAAVIEAMLRRIPHFQDARKRLSQAVFRGQSSEMILGRREWVSLADMPMQDWYVPTGLKHIDPRRFIIKPERERDASGALHVKGKLYISAVPTFDASSRSQELFLGRYVPVNHPEWLIRVVYDDEESRVGFGRGIMDVLYFYHWAKQIVLREGLQGLERWAQGIVVGKVDPDKRGATDQDSETIRDTMVTKLKAMRSRNVFAMNVGEEIEVVTGGMEGHQIVMGLLQYLDNSLIAVATGASLKSAGDVGVAGTYASDKVGSDIQQGVVRFDIGKLDEDITLDLVGLLDRLNRPQWKKLGAALGVSDLADALPPDFRTIQKRVSDPQKSASKFATLSQLGRPVRIKRDEFYDEIGNTPPDEGDETVELGGAPQERPGFPYLAESPVETVSEEPDELLPAVAPGIDTTAHPAPSERKSGAAPAMDGATAHGEYRKPPSAAEKVTPTKTPALPDSGGEVEGLDRAAPGEPISTGTGPGPASVEEFPRTPERLLPRGGPTPASPIPKSVGRAPAVERSVPVPAPEKGVRTPGGVQHAILPPDGGAIEAPGDPKKKTQVEVDGRKNPKGGAIKP